jgi:hypothetical protein
MRLAEYLWHASYWEAICETDDSLVAGRILQARSALEQRLLSPIDPDSEEYRAIKNAKKALGVLEAERAHKHENDRPDFGLGFDQPSA